MQSSFRCLLLLESVCPLSHPFVYSNGNYCCSSGQEKDGTLVPSCDGGPIGFHSVCCLGDNFVPCNQPPCQNNAPAATTTTIAPTTTGMNMSQKYMLCQIQFDLSPQRVPAHQAIHLYIPMEIIVAHLLWRKMVILFLSVMVVQ